MEIAVQNRCGITEVFEMLAEVAEITDKVKLMQLSELMCSDNPEEFKTKLKFLPVDLVRIVFRMCSLNVCASR